MTLPSRSESVETPWVETSESEAPSGVRARSAADFPLEIPSILGGTMRRRYYLPHIWTQPLDSSPFALYWSGRDGFGCLHPLPTAEELTRFYGESYYTHADYREEKVRDHLLDRARWAIACRVKSEGDPTDADLERFVGRGRRRVCDVGCGSGFALERLARLGHDVIGVEPDEKAREHARSKGLTVLAGTGEALPDELEPESFDFVQMIQAFEHVSNPLQTLANVNRLLKPGGRLLLETPNHESLGFETWGPAWFHTDAGRHLWFFTNAGLRQFGRHVGLEPLTTYYRGYARQFAASWIHEESKVWDRLAAGGNEPATPRPSSWGATRLFLRSLVAEPRETHDSVGVLFEKPL